MGCCIKRKDEEEKAKEYQEKDETPGKTEGNDAENSIKTYRITKIDHSRVRSRVNHTDTNNRNDNDNRYEIDRESHDKNRIYTNLNESFLKQEYMCANNSLFEVSITSGIENENNKSISFDFEEKTQSNSKYLSISSKSIKSPTFNYHEENKDISAALYLIQNKSYTFFYFEISYLLIWAKEFLKFLYPILNIILVIEINDDISSQEKIFFQKSEKAEEDKYSPMLKTEDINRKHYRVMKVVESNKELEDIVHKISFKLFTYYNNKLLTISDDDIYVIHNLTDEAHKYKYCLNNNMKYYNKKIGNLLINIAHKTECLNEKDITKRKAKLYSTFSNLKSVCKFTEDALLIYKYNQIPNCLISGHRKSPSSESLSFHSIEDVFETDFGLELKGENLPLNRLLEMFDQVKYSYDLYILLKKITIFSDSNELGNEMTIFVIEKIEEKLKNILTITEDNRDIKNDIFLVPLLYNTLKLLCFKKKEKERKSKKINVNETNLMEKMIKIMRNILETSYKLLICKYTNANISFSILYYIYKHMEEPLSQFMQDEVKIRNSDEYITTFILEKKLYNNLFSIMNKFYKNCSCVAAVIGIISKILKSKKQEAKEIMPFISCDFETIQTLKKVFQLYDCNNNIMTNLIYIFYFSIEHYKIETNAILNLVDFERLRELFYTFKNNGFELIHEAILYLIKSILMRKNDKQSESNTTFNENDFNEIITIFSLAIDYIKLKILLSKEISKIAKMSSTLLNYIYIIANIINNCFQRNVEICKEKRISELLIDCFLAFCERNVFETLETIFDKLDQNSINTKAMIFRTLFHMISVVKNLKDELRSTFPRQSGEKMIKIVMYFEQNEGLYKTDLLYKEIEKIKNPENKNRLTTLVNSLKDFYSRYKKRVIEFKKDIIFVLKGE